jgi:hypothetical protein
MGGFFSSIPPSPAKEICICKQKKASNNKPSLLQTLVLLFTYIAIAVL